MLRMLSDARPALRALLAHIEKIDRRRRLAELEERLARTRIPERKDELRLAILAIVDERRAGWLRRRRAYHQTERIRVARRITAPRRQLHRKVDPSAGT